MQVQVCDPQNCPSAFTSMLGAVPRMWLKSSKCQQIWATWCLLYIYVHSWNLRKKSFLQSPQQLSVWYVLRPCPACAVRGVFTECHDYGSSYSNLQHVPHFPVNVISEWFTQSSPGDRERFPPPQKSAITDQAEWKSFCHSCRSWAVWQNQNSRFIEIPEKGRWYILPKYFPYPKLSPNYQLMEFFL